jgi:hypothetical protein
LRWNAETVVVLALARSDAISLSVAAAPGASVAATISRFSASGHRLFRRRR